MISIKKIIKLIVRKPIFSKDLVLVRDILINSVTMKAQKYPIVLLLSFRHLKVNKLILSRLLLQPAAIGIHYGSLYILANKGSVNRTFYNSSLCPVRSC